MDAKLLCERMLKSLEAYRNYEGRGRRRRYTTKRIEGRLIRRKGENAILRSLSHHVILNIKLREGKKCDFGALLSDPQDGFDYLGCDENDLYVVVAKDIDGEFYCCPCVLPLAIVESIQFLWDEG